MRRLLPPPLPSTQLCKKKMNPNENQVPMLKGRNKIRFIVSQAGPIDSVTRMIAA
jgi:hypothetical protein